MKLKKPHPRGARKRSTAKEGTRIESRVRIGRKIDGRDVLGVRFGGNKLDVPVTKRNVASIRSVIINRIRDIIPRAVKPAVTIEEQAGTGRSGDRPNVGAIVGVERRILVNP
jgi:hypothetical protein